jgi:hypothetical protein
MTKPKEAKAIVLCESCAMETGDDVYADWMVFWKDPDNDAQLCVAICENCYKMWKVEFAQTHQKFRSQRVKNKRPFVFR